jgi:hypothetical protein
MRAIHPLVLQMKFTRSELFRGLKGLNEEEESKRFLPMDCISWSVVHLAWQEQWYFLFYGMGLMPFPDIQSAFKSGGPASQPILHQVLDYWREITESANPWLERLTTEQLQENYLKRDGQLSSRSIGSLLQRVICHFLYLMDESLTIRQMLGHRRLPVYG